MTLRSRPLALLVLVAVLATAGCGDDDEQTTTAPGASGDEPVREALAQSDEPPAAPGRALGLSRVTIPPGAELPLHFHDGTQVAYIDAGTLTYTVKKGSVEVTSGSPDESPEPVRTIETGETGTIEAGQWIVEQEPVIHKGANEGDEPIVVLLSTLLRKGALPATPVE